MLSSLSNNNAVGISISAFSHVVNAYAGDCPALKYTMWIKAEVPLASNSTFPPLTPTYARICRLAKLRAIIVCQRLNIARAMVPTAISAVSRTSGSLIIFSHIATVRRIFLLVFLFRQYRKSCGQFFGNCPILYRIGHSPDRVGNLCCLRHDPVSGDRDRCGRNSLVNRRLKVMRILTFQSVSSCCRKHCSLGTT